MEEKLTPNTQLDYDNDNINVVGCEEDYRNLVAGIRKRPGMYLGNTSQRGLNLLISELIHIVASDDRDRHQQIEVEIKSPDRICLSGNNLDCFNNLQFESELMFSIWKLWRSRATDLDLFNIGSIEYLTIATALSSECKLAIEQQGKSIEIIYHQGLEISSGEIEIQNRDYFDLELTIDRQIFTTVKKQVDRQKYLLSIDADRDREIFAPAIFDDREIEKIIYQISYFYPNIRFQIKNSSSRSLQSISIQQPEGLKHLILDTIDLVYPFDYLSHYRNSITERDIFQAIESNPSNTILGELFIGALPETNTTSLIGFVNCRRACLAKSSRQKFQHKLNKIIVDRLQKIDDNDEDLPKLNIIEPSSIYPGLVCAIVIYTKQSIFAGPTRDYIQGKLVDGILDLLLDRFATDLAKTNENMPGLLQQLYRTALYDY
jgi:DNA gyrase/topoisomerase IV subunit B